VSLNGTERRDTNTVIEQYVGKYEDFVLTALSLQGNNSIFIDKSQSERKDLLAQFMGLNVFDKLYDTAMEDIKEVSVSY
jgi:DNA repair exonuclease SbcCD ATPase subunit